MQLDKVYHVLVVLFGLVGLDQVAHFALFAELDYALVVPLGYLLGDSEGAGDFLGDAELVQGDVGVRADDASS